jgi:magnesium transporter
MFEGERKQLKKISKKIISPFVKEKTRAVINPFVPNKEKEFLSEKTEITVYYFNEKFLHVEQAINVDQLNKFKNKNAVSWINVDGINKATVEKIAYDFNIHFLIQEDILSYGQRPKMDDVENTTYVLLNMLYYNTETTTIEHEQISIVLTKHVVISFQEDATRDVFNPIREKLKLGAFKIRQRGADYLFYCLIDMIVDSYFQVLEKLGERIEIVEEQLLTKVNKQSFQSINELRKDIILLKRNTTPVRDLVSALLRSESDLLEERTTKYFKDVYDHIAQVNDLTENYRDMVTSLQDLYINTVNLRMNEVMKTLAIVTTVMAPATVIGGIFGMNFEIIPYSHQRWGFYATVSVMIIIPVLMIFWFKKRGWFQRDLPEDNTSKF